MKKASFLLILICGSVLADEPQMQYPTVYRGEVELSPNDPNLQGLKWKVWGSGRYAVMSLNAEQGQYVAKNLNKMENWISNRWALNRLNFNPSSSCIIYCVYDQQLMRKIYNGLDESWVEIRKKNGQIEVVAIWLLLNDNPLKTIPAPITEALLADLTTKYSVSYSIIRGM